MLFNTLFTSSGQHSFIQQQLMLYFYYQGQTRSSRREKAHKVLSAPWCTSGYFRLYRFLKVLLQ